MKTSMILNGYINGFLIGFTLKERKDMFGQCFMIIIMHSQIGIRFDSPTHLDFYLYAIPPCKKDVSCCIFCLIVML